MGMIRHLYHLVFVTKGRRMTIPTAGRALMLDRMKRIFVGKGCRVYAADAFLNHAHVLVHISKPDDFSRIVNKVKSSTGMVYHKYPEYASFTGWAAGFDSFSVSFGDLERVKRLIERQQTIHLELSFEEEYARLLEENGFDPCRTSIPVSSLEYPDGNCNT